jgi:tetratricopeptide (TPR) repeat protein
MRRLLLECQRNRSVTGRTAGCVAAGGCSFGFGLLVTVTLAATLVLTNSMPQVVLANEQNEAAALTILQAANSNYKEKKFVKAAQMYVTAFEVSKNPAYLFNAARAYQRGYRLEDSEALYKRCLTLVNDPQSKVVRRARVHLQEIEEARKALAAAAEAGSTAAKDGADEPKASSSQTPATGKGVVADKKVVPALPPSSNSRLSVELAADRPTKRPAWKRYVTWGLLGGGGVIAAVAGWTISKAVDDKAELEKQLANQKRGDKVVMNYQTYATQVSNINGELYTGYGLVAVGVVAIGTGAWMLVGAEDAATSVAVLPSAHGVRFGLATRF